MESGTEEEKYLKERHLENNTFEAGLSMSVNGDGGRRCFIEGEEVRVVTVAIKDGRVSDWKGQVRDFELQDADLPNGL